MNEPSIVRQHRSKLARMVQSIQQLSLARDENRIAEIVRRAARELTGADGATLVLREGDFCHYVDEDAIAPLWKGRRFAQSECISGWAMRQGQPAVVADIDTDPRVPKSLYADTFVKSLVVVPIRASAPLGAIGAYWARKHHPSDEEIDLLRALADSAAVAMENVSLYAELETRVRERTAALEREIGERERAEQMLRDSRQRLAGIIDSAMDAIISIDGEQRIVLFNPAAETMFGFRAAEVLGKSIDCLIPSSLRPAHGDHVRAFLATGATSRALGDVRALRGMRANGEEFPVEASVSRLDLANGMVATVVVRDATQRIKAESALAESEARLRYVTEAAEIGYWDWDLTTGRLTWSNHCKTLFGIAAAEPMSYARFLAAVYPDDRQAVDARVRTALAGKGSYEIEFRTGQADGTLGWVRAKGRVTFGADGSATRMGGVAMDVTARRQMEAALRESEAKFRNMADTAPAMLWVSEPDGRCCFLSQGWYDYTGQTEAVGLGHGWLECVHPEDREGVMSAFFAANRRLEPFHCEYRLRRADGGYRWALDTARPRLAADGSFLGYIGSVIDITERRSAEQALRESQQLLQMFVEGTPAGIAMFDREMRFLAVSRRFLHDYRVTEPVIGRDHYEVFPEISDHWREAHRRCLAGETLRMEEDVFVRADGSVQWVRWEVSPWFTAAGDVGGLLLFSEEVTARKRAEDALRAAKAEAERADAAKSRFLAAASHDLRQPLSALSLYAKILEGHVDAAGTPLLTKLKTCLGSLGGLLSDLLDLSKLQAGVVTPHPDDFAVADVLSSLVSVHEPEARSKSLHLRCRPSALWARTDPVLFQRIVGNVIGNAVRYTDRGGVLVGCRRRKGKTWVEVWDTGIGIAPDKTDEIFEEFRQLGDDARTRGSGLGLAIVAKTAALLGLEINVRSRPGRGSVFAIELPRGQAGSAVLPEFDIVPARTLRIALVEDNAVVREALTEALRSIGHRVLAAESGQSLGALLGREAPDIVVSDYRLRHGETGFDVIELVRNAVAWELPAILLTGDTDPDLVRNMAARGILVLHKPVDLETLQAYIDDLTIEAESVPR